MNVKMASGKGMSQTLALIVAASVLMMTALTVIFLAQGSLGDVGQDSTERGCQSALEAKMRTMSPGDVAQDPGNCRTAAGDPVSNAPSAIGSSDCFQLSSSATRPYSTSTDLTDNAC